MKFLHLFIQLLFPSTCVVCGKPNTKLHYECTKLLLPSPKHNPLNDEWIYSCFAYRDKRMKKLIKYLKSHEDTELVTTLGKILYEKIKNKKINIISCIPASYDRMKRYGFNQSALLAVALTKNIKNSNYYDLFIRTKEIPKQALIHERAKRLQNPIGAFALKEKYKDFVKNKTIILVDDVTTTGATLSELRKILLDNGASHVLAVTVGH